jgi:hypothetical protein
MMTVRPWCLDHKSNNLVDFACQGVPRKGKFALMSNFYSFRRACGIVVAAIFLLGSASFSHATIQHAGPAMPANIEAPDAPIIVYNSAAGASGTLTPATGTGVTSFLVPVSFSAGPGTYTVTQMILGVNFNAIGAGQQDIFIDFYNNLNLSPGAADALAGATSAGASQGIGLGDPPNAGNFAFTVTFTTPVVLNVGANFGMVFSFFDDASQTYSTEISGLFRLGGAPNVGSSPGFVYNDANQDGVFPGSEQTKLGNPTSANYYLRVTADAPVPEPSTWAMMVGGLGIVALALRRRCRA